ncbi:hypothetical protein K402DRAFT_408475 [Aulographum hederae CBS 113979]|uniref:Uncharacterized protein n=1 Tax=Aulographum hederae CBS 113979 TaxID=1176131 RepID=A0A6G1GL08_9PEZI|nr:hypothetical protein K402DRAFT_408475 [Aulographum hederae CBS 113979]
MPSRTKSKSPSPPLFWTESAIQNLSDADKLLTSLHLRKKITPTPLQQRCLSYLFLCTHTPNPKSSLDATTDVTNKNSVLNGAKLIFRPSTAVPEMPLPPPTNTSPTPAYRFSVLAICSTCLSFRNLTSHLHSRKLKDSSPDLWREKKEAEAKESLRCLECWSASQEKRWNEFETELKRWVRGVEMGREEWIRYGRLRGRVVLGEVRVMKERMGRGERFERDGRDGDEETVEDGDGDDEETVHGSDGLADADAGEEEIESSDSNTEVEKSKETVVKEENTDTEPMSRTAKLRWAWRTLKAIMEEKRAMRKWGDLRREEFLTVLWAIDERKQLLVWVEVYGREMEGKRKADEEGMGREKRELEELLEGYSKGCERGEKGLKHKRSALVERLLEVLMPAL